MLLHSKFSRFFSPTQIFIQHKRASYSLGFLIVLCKMLNVRITANSSVSGIGIQQIRFVSRRKYVYPQGYKPVVDPQSHPKKDHRTWFKRHLEGWLGPRNIRGEYYKNKYFYPPQDHNPKYVVQDGITDGTVVSNEAPAYFRNTRSKFQPFPENPHCKTNVMISNELKEKLHTELTANGLHAQQVAHKYGISIARVEAISRLQEIKNEWENKHKISKDLKNFSNVMYKMFPLYEPPVNAENLTEIPTPSKTLHQRFLTISESEPFGPLDAAPLFDLEPAQETLNKLTELQDHSGSDAVNHKKLNKVLIGAQALKDRHLFKFSHGKVGEVGHRYGASRRDTKKDRKIGFNPQGRMVYM